ncbi:toxic anion resistance protein [Hydrogenimonas sp. SS33]|uniref:toxic anion resistance protein n=1 Tax=Hydrogenimonas leucolamina TaxID=2954236 RepID=UPI00336BD80D
MNKTNQEAVVPEAAGMESVTVPEALKKSVEKSIEAKSETPSPIQPDEEEKIQKAMAEIDFHDHSSVIRFGSTAQEKLDEISNRMIDGVKNKDTGAAGESLNKMVAAIRGFDIDSLNPNKKLSWWQKLLGKAEPLATFLQRYEEVRDQLDVIATDLEKHKAQLTSDVIALDKLYDANLEYFRQLELYIEAGERKLKELEEKIIPEYEKKAESGEMMDVQNLRELRNFRDDLERRVHDLRLSRQVAMQALPSIRLIQENDKSLINKISSTLVNTVPLWRNQLAQTVTIFRSHAAAGAIKQAGDLTNELLERNAEGLREANREVREQMERGVYDIESIKKANQTLIATLNDSLEIAEKGKEARQKALGELQKSEAALKEALLKVKSAREGIGTASETGQTPAKEG